MFKKEDFIVDGIYGERLLISKEADQSELDENIRVARVLLNYFDDMNIRINKHLLVFGHKNPEYTINEKLGDRKGVESENGIKSAFRKAKELGVVTVAMTGASGGEMKAMADYLLNVPSTDTPRIQESHIMLGHIICEIVEANMFPRANS